VLQQNMNHEKVYLSIRSLRLTQ